MNYVNKCNRKCPQNTISYIVKPGDTLFRIASRNKTTIEVLLELNPELNTNLLIPGIVMCIPISMDKPPINPPKGMPECNTPQVPNIPDIPEPRSVPRPEPRSVPRTMPDMDEFNNMNDMQNNRNNMNNMNDTQNNRNNMNNTTDNIMLPIMPPSQMPPMNEPSMPTRPMFPDAEQMQPNCRGMMRYTIRSGDTLYNIAKRYDITLYDLLNANRNINPYNLQIGQIICIPVAENACPYGKFYTIQAGDTLATILTKFRISASTLRAANEGLDVNNLREGMKICIPPFMAYDDCISQRTYIIEDGDNLIRVAEKANVSACDLLSFNPKLRPEDFSEVGLRICLPAERAPFR